MWGKRLDRHFEVEAEDGGSAVGAFVAVPAMMGGTTFQQ